MSNSSKPGITLRTPNLILGQDLFTKLPQDMTKKDIENLYPILSQDDILAGTFQTLLPEEQKKMYDEVVDEQNIYQNLPPAKRSSEDAKQQSVAINHAKLNTIYFLTTHLFPLPSPTHLKKLSNITFNTIKDIDILNACIKKPEAGYLISYIIDLIPNSPTHYSFINDSNKHKSIDEIADSLINQALLAQTKHRKITQQAELYFNTLREQNTKTSSRQIPKPEPAKLPDPDAPPIPTKTYDTIPQRIIPESETEEYVNLPPLPHNKAKDLDVDEVYELIHQIEKELPLPARTKHTEHTTTSRNSQVPTFAPAAHMPNPIKPKLRMPLMPLQTEVDKPVTPASDSAAQKVSHFRSIVTPQIPQDTLDSISVRYPAANPETIQRFYNNLSLVTLSISRVHTLDDNRSLLDS